MASHRNPNPLGARDFTDYHTRCATFAATHGVGKTAHEHRHYLIEHADEMIDESRKRIQMCAPELGLTPGESELSLCGSSTCEVRAGDPAGLGRGRAVAEGDAHPAPFEPSLQLFQSTK
jgi:hypothetical protein